MLDKKIIIQKRIRAAAREFISFIYPPRCPLCDDIMNPGVLLCPACMGSVKRIEGSVCMRCGKPVSEESREYCSDCIRKRHYFTQGKAAFVYDEKIRQSMYRFKYGNRREYAVFYAKEAARLYADWIRSRQIEAIIPIPMYPGKKRLRGYNQAEVFARQFGRETGILVDTKALCRVRDTTPQKELNETERKHNLKNAFQLNADIVKYNIVMLVDDIYTTGSTMDAAAKLLLAAGVKDIYFICISIGAGYR